MWPKLQSFAPLARRGPNSQAELHAVIDAIPMADGGEGTLDATSAPPAGASAPGAGGAPGEVPDAAPAVGATGLTVRAGQNQGAQPLMMQVLNGDIRTVLRVRELGRVILECIRARRASGERPYDFLSLFLDARTAARVVILAGCGEPDAEAEPHPFDGTQMNADGRR